MPITLANGHRDTFIPQRQRLQAVYVQDEAGSSIQLWRQREPRGSTRSPVIVESRAAPCGRSWEKEALIIGKGAGTAIGALAGGKKGCWRCALGGVGGLIYDLTTRNK